MRRARALQRAPTTPHSVAGRALSTRKTAGAAALAGGGASANPRKLSASEPLAKAELRLARTPPAAELRACERASAGQRRELSCGANPSLSAG
jgi:hypothetical protein